MAIEMVASRFLTPVFGGSIMTWAALIAVVMVALALGYIIGGRLADRYPRPTLAGLLVSVAGLYLLPIAHVGAELLEQLQRVGLDPRLSCLLGATLLTLVPAALLATCAPFALRLGVIEADRTGRVAGLLYGVSTFGSVVGTLFTAFVLVPTMGSAHIMTGLSVFVLLSGLPFFLMAVQGTPSDGPRPRAMLLVGAVVIVGLLVAVFGMPRANSTPTSTAADQTQTATSTRSDTLLETRQSLYSDIDVVRSGDYLSLRFARTGHFWNESRIHVDDPGELPLVYNRVMLVGLAYPRAPTSLLLLGLGGGSISRYLDAFMPELAITGVELDAEVIDLARTYFHLGETAVDIVHADGRVHLRQNDQRHDLIMVDTYRGGVVPFHMVTREFFALARDRLKPDGALVINLHARSRLLDAVLATLRATFQRVDTYSAPQSGNVIVVGTDAELNDTDIASRATALQMRLGLPYHLRSLLSLRTEIEPADATDVLVDDFAPATWLAAVEAHNHRLNPGAEERHRPRASAAVIDPVRIDGDLSDWPEHLTEHSILVNGAVYGPTDLDDDDLATSADLSARFMVAWNPTDGLLYAALRVRDDLHVADGADPWTNDACELYLAPRADATMFVGDFSAATASDLPVQQYIAVPGPGAYEVGGDNPALGRGQIALTRSSAAWQRRDNVTTYEWALELFSRYPDQRQALTTGAMFGFDIVVVDKDGEGDPSWIHWGPRAPRKYANPSGLGILQLLPAR